MNLITLGWTLSKAACTESVIYTIELQAGGPAPLIFG